MNTIRLWPLDSNQILLFDTNEIWLSDPTGELPENWEANAQGPIIGGDDIKKVSRTAGAPNVKGSGGIN